jgi:hypothetical protein
MNSDSTKREPAHEQWTGEEAAGEEHLPSHRDLLPPDLCPYLVMKPMQIGTLDEKIYDGREDPGDGYYWCELSCHDIGPDDELVHPRSCNKQRSCHPEAPRL